MDNGQWYLYEIYNYIIIFFKALQVVGWIFCFSLFLNYCDTIYVFANTSQIMLQN